MMIVTLGPDAAGRNLLCKKVDGVAEVFVAKPRAEERASICVVLLTRLVHR